MRESIPTELRFGHRHKFVIRLFAPSLQRSSVGDLKFPLVAFALLEELVREVNRAAVVGVQQGVSNHECWVDF